MRGQQTCPLKIYINMWTVSSNVSKQRRHWRPFSVHLWTNFAHPIHDVNHLWRLVTPLGCMSLTFFEQRCTRTRSVWVLWDGTYGFSSLSEKTRKSNRLQMSLQKQLICKDPECWSGRGFEPVTSRSADRRSPNWANQAAVKVAETYPIFMSMWRTTFKIGRAWKSRYNNRSEISVLKCKKMPYSVWFSCRRKTEWTYSRRRNVPICIRVQILHNHSPLVVNRIELTPKLNQVLIFILNIWNSL